jgi:hypothetical protein
MARSMYDPDPVAVDEVPLEASQLDAIEAVLHDECGADCHELWVYELTQVDAGRYDGQFARTFETPDRVEKFDFTVRADDDTDSWRLTATTRIAVSSVRHNESLAYEFIRPPDLSDPLDLTPSEYDELDQALQSNSPEYRKARERGSNYRSIYYLERLGSDRYDVLFYAMWGGKPSWTHHLRTQVRRLDGPETWAVDDVELEEKYNWA